MTDIYMPAYTFTCGDAAECHADDHVYCTPTVDEIDVCGVCAIVLTHTGENRDSLVAMFTNTTDWTGTVALTDDEPVHMLAACDTCGDSTPGMRWSATHTHNG